MTLRLLCANHDPKTRRDLARVLEEEGYEGREASSARGALMTLAEERIDALLVDLCLPDMSGEEFLAAVQETYPSVDVVLLVDPASRGRVEEASRVGVSDVVEKPLQSEYLKSRLRLIEDRRRLADENRQLRGLLGEEAQSYEFVGTCSAMKRLVKLARRLGQNDTTVLILGESGTGKEQLARLIHFGGERSSLPFVPVDCGALAPSLIESELFGHVKGAFTGAQRDSTGLLASALGGTVFLDEIGELPNHLQAKLLRAIQERQVRPLGSTEPRTFNARIIAATNRILEEEVARGNFREDLYYRLSVVSLELPSLRERTEDLPLLVMHFLKKFSRTKRRVTGVSLSAMKAIETYSWPGNVRELENAIEHAIAVGCEDLIRLEDLPGKLKDQAPALATTLDLPPEEKTLAAFERRAIRQILAETGGNKREAARVLDISVTTLYRKLKEVEGAPR